MRMIRKGLLAMTMLWLAACAGTGNGRPMLFRDCKLIQLRQGRTISLHAMENFDGGIDMQGMGDDGEIYSGEAREMRTDELTTRLENDTLKVDGRILHGTGYVRSMDGKTTVSFEYRREDNGGGVGKGKDNQGGEYQFLF